MFDEINSNQYFGKVLKISDTLLVQKIGRDESNIFRHNLAKFEISRCPSVGDYVEIKYKDGIGQITLHKSSVCRDSPELEPKGTPPRGR